jgi:hypothetical protein
LALLCAYATPIEFLVYWYVRLTDYHIVIAKLADTILGDLRGKQSGRCKRDLAPANIAKRGDALNLKCASVG